MGAGASIEDTGDLKKEYEKVKPSLTETQKTTLEETYKKVEGKNEFLIIGKCKKAYAELGIEGADPAFLPKEKKAAAPPPTKAPEPKKVQGLGAMLSLTHAAPGRPRGAPTRPPAYPMRGRSQIRYRPWGDLPSRWPNDWHHRACHPPQ